MENYFPIVGNVEAVIEAPLYFIPKAHIDMKISKERH